MNTFNTVKTAEEVTMLTSFYYRKSKEYSALNLVVVQPYFNVTKSAAEYEQWKHLQALLRNIENTLWTNGVNVYN